MTTKPTRNEAIQRVYEPQPETITGRLLEAAVQFVFPAPCLGCQKPLTAGEQSLGLCPHCRQRLVQPATGCGICGRPLLAWPAPSDGRCPTCRAEPPACARLLAAWSYEPPLDEVIKALKFSRLDYLGAHLAASIVARLAPQLEGHDLVVAVPLHWRRWLERGYNQAERIARPLTRAMQLPFLRALRRKKHTHPQIGLSRRERIENVRGAFVCRRRHSVQGKRILLIDDVTTTGGTLAEASRCLREAGAQLVTAVVAARTAPDTELPTAL